ncbi:MAG: hypothetical protein SFZ23_12260 [Planctomycetota bacterium]|nr:hypothetical protein [Planctomycetota bacterium]
MKPVLLIALGCSAAAALAQSAGQATGQSSTWQSQNRSQSEQYRPPLDQDRQYAPQQQNQYQNQYQQNQYQDRWRSDNQYQNQQNWDQNQRWNDDRSRTQDWNQNNNWNQNNQDRWQSGMGDASEARELLQRLEGAYRVDVIVNTKNMKALKAARGHGNQNSTNQNWNNQDWGNQTNQNQAWNRDNNDAWNQTAGQDNVKRCRAYAVSNVIMGGTILRQSIVSNDMAMNKLTSSGGQQQQQAYGYGAQDDIQNLRLDEDAFRGLSFISFDAENDRYNAVFMDSATGDIKTHAGKFDASQGRIVFSSASGSSSYQTSYGTGTGSGTNVLDLPQHLPENYNDAGVTRTDPWNSNQTTDRDNWNNDNQNWDRTNQNWYDNNQNQTDRSRNQNSTNRSNTSGAGSTGTWNRDTNRTNDTWNSPSRSWDRDTTDNTNRRRSNTDPDNSFHSSRLLRNEEAWHQPTSAEAHRASPWGGSTRFVSQSSGRYDPSRTTDSTKRRDTGYRAGDPTGPLDDDRNNPTPRSQDQTNRNNPEQDVVRYDPNPIGESRSSVQGRLQTGTTTQPRTGTSTTQRYNQQQYNQQQYNQQPYGQSSTTTPRYTTSTSSGEVVLEILGPDQYRVTMYKAGTSSAAMQRSQLYGNQSSTTRPGGAWGTQDQNQYQANQQLDDNIIYTATYTRLSGQDEQSLMRLLGNDDLASMNRGRNWSGQRNSIRDDAWNRNQNNNTNNWNQNRNNWNQNNNNTWDRNRSTTDTDLWNTPRDRDQNRWNDDNTWRDRDDNNRSDTYRDNSNRSDTDRDD